LSLEIPAGKEIDRLQANGTLTKVETAEWLTPAVWVKKVNGDLRMCADFSTGLNASLLDDDYPLPIMENLFAKLANSKIFTLLDLSEAYYQLELDDKSEPLTIIVTHQGMFDRLPFGVRPAPPIFNE